MTAAALLADLQARGVRVAVKGGRLQVEAPKGAVDPAVRAALAEHKAELLAALYPWPGSCYCCQEVCWWLSKHGVVICGRCHPPPYPDMVAVWVPQAGCRWREGLQ